MWSLDQMHTPPWLRHHERSHLIGLWCRVGCIVRHGQNRTVDQLLSLLLEANTGPRAGNGGIETVKTIVAHRITVTVRVKDHVPIFDPNCLTLTTSSTIQRSPSHLNCNSRVRDTALLNFCQLNVNSSFRHTVFTAQQMMHR